MLTLSDKIEELKKIGLNVTIDSSDGSAHDSS